MAIVHITKENYENEIINSEKTVLLDFWAPWCVPCRAVGKIVEELDGEQNEVKMAKIDIEACPELAVSLGIMSIPALIIFKNGKVIEKMVGVHSKKAILKKLAKI